MPNKTLDAEALVLAVLGALPTHEVRGRKRLQKMAFFAVNTGAESSVRFFLHDYGPFSSEVAGATDMLSYEGTITEEDAQFERTKRFYKRYRLPDPKVVREKLPSDSSGALKRLDEYSTVELEIASTILFFMGQGHSSDRAIQETKDLKPSKSEPRIIERATEALLKVGLYERGRTDSMSSPRSY